MIASETPFGVFRSWPPGRRSLLAVDSAIDEADLPAGLLELVRLRVSQINRCAYCVAMHVAKARANGASEEALTMLLVWREVTSFSARERAALAVAEAMTLPADTAILPRRRLGGKARLHRRRTHSVGLCGRHHQRLEPIGACRRPGAWIEDRRFVARRRYQSPGLP